MKLLSRILFHLILLKFCVAVCAEIEVPLWTLYKIKTESEKKIFLVLSTEARENLLWQVFVHQCCEDTLSVVHLTK